MSESEGPVSSQDVIYLSSMLAVVPIGWVHRRIQSPQLRHVYSLISGLILLYINFGWSLYELVLMALGTYSIVVVPFVADSMRHWVTLLFTMSFLTATHLHRMIVDYGGWKMDISGPMMVIALKCIAYAMSSRWSQMSDDKLDEYEKVHRLQKKAEILPFLSYIFFYGTALVGPFHEYNEYALWISQTHAETPEEREGRHRAIKDRVVKTLICLVGMGVGLTYFPVSSFSTPFFSSLSFPMRVSYYHIAFVLLRAKYYFAWYFAEWGCLMSGFGRSHTGEWNLLLNQNPLDVELPYKGMHHTSIAWNVKVHHFLKHYVFNAMRKSKKMGKFAFYGAYMFSAFWHGLYPGYFIFFLAYGALGSLGRDFSRLLAHHFPSLSLSLSTSLPLSTATALLGILLVEFVAAGFHVLVLAETVKVWTDLWHFGWIILVGGKLICALVPMPPREKRQKKA